MSPTADALARARRLCESGHHSAAEGICCQILAAAPNAASAVHLRALLALKRNDAQSAIDFIQRAIEIEPMSAEHHGLLGTAYRELGKLAEAAACYRQAIRLNPHLAAIHNNLGTTLFAQREVAGAIKCYERTIEIDPQLAAAHFNLGNAWQAQQQFDKATTCYQTALRIDPNYGDAHANLGAVFFSQGHIERARCHLEKALSLLPNSAEVHNSVGAIREHLGDIEKAIALYRMAIRLQPDYVDAVANLCDALVGQERFAEAVKSYEMLRDFMPESPEVHNNLGVSLQRDGRMKEAIQSYERALELDPNYPAALSNLGAVLHDAHELSLAETAYRRAISLQSELVEANVGLAKVLDDAQQYDKALAYFNHAVKLAPNDAEVRFARALALLRRGDFERGWREYEWRWKTSQFQARDLPAPPWNGEPLMGRTILIHAEQGLGDTIQFVRYLPLVKAAGGTVIFAAQERLKPLLGLAAGVDKFIALGNQMPALSVHAPLLSLPHIFKTRLETIPGNTPYLTVDEELVESIRTRMQRFQGLKVGVCWQGNPEHRRDKARSIPFQYIDLLADIAGVTLINLQSQRESGSMDRPSDHRIVEITKSLDEAAGPFMETAAIMMNLDLVISCDSAVAHLAGALGVPIWTALDHAADWRWMCHRNDSPWYPTMRLFRQAVVGDWDGVFATLCDVLRERV